jgi:hypothetical protein
MGALCHPKISQQTEYTFRTFLLLVAKELES